MPTIQLLAFKQNVIPVQAPKMFLSSELDGMSGGYWIIVDVFGI